jgi:hypothetical protein
MATLDCKLIVHLICENIPEVSSNSITRIIFHLCNLVLFFWSFISFPKFFPVFP